MSTPYSATFEMADEREGQSGGTEREADWSRWFAITLVLPGSLFAVPILVLWVGLKKSK